MIRSLKKPLTAAALSLSVALGAVSVPAAPARADGEDIAGVIAGLTALYFIGRAIERHNDRGRVTTRNVTPHLPHRITPHLPHRNLRVAPARCFRDFHGVRGYLARCMQNNVARPGTLPPECIVRIDTNRGPRNLYAGRCLARNGWQREAGFRP